MINYIDDFLNRITMYRVVLYYLLALNGIAVIFSYFGILSYDPFLLFVSIGVILFFSVCANYAFSKIFKAVTNVESVYITAFILSLIITPIRTVSDISFLVWVAVIAMASKYILAVNKKHVFNPAAVAVVITYFVLGKAASWWVGNLPMMPFVVLGGLLVARKIRREDMVFVFIVVAVSASLLPIVFGSGDVLQVFTVLAFHSSFFFLAFVMLTEPLTSPATKKMQVVYAAITGFLFAPQIHIGSIYATPELALIIGNVFSYIVSPKERLVLSLRDKIQLTKDIFDFVFPLKQKLTFSPGQYMEWTLPHEKSDSRGNRRYFTLASSPTEDVLRIGVKFNEPPSSFKKRLLEMNPGDTIIAGQRAGDFTLPKNTQEKIVLIAGGIGITPFRSMLKYLIDTDEKRDIVMFYSNKNAADIVYEEMLTQAQKGLGIKVIYTVTQTDTVSGWTGKVGRISETMIAEEVPDYLERTFYLSGPHAMVIGFENVLIKMNVPESQIKTDFFPGFV